MKSCALASDLVVNAIHITLLLCHEKEKKWLMASYMNIRQIACREVPVRIMPFHLDGVLLEGCSRLGLDRVISIVFSSSL